MSGAVFDGGHGGHGGIAQMTAQGAQPTSGTKRQRTIVLAGGGTGGHISPGLAIAERIKSLSPDVRIVFACSTRAIDATMLREAGAEFTPIRAQGFALHPRKLTRFLLGLVRARSDAAQMIDRLKPAWIVALGGFVTPPVVAAARRAGVPVMLVNLDATPGKANRWVASRADTVVSAVAVPAIPGFASAVIGMPIRRIAIAPASSELCRAELGLDPNSPVLLITGASQGAQSLNELSLALAREHRGAFAAWQVLHLCGDSPSGGIARYERAWREAGIRAAVLPFVHRMGVAWGAAELALSRAGANSVAEVQANRVATLFAPYPYHQDLHQRENAMPLVGRGAAAMELDLVDPAKNLAGLGATLLRLMGSPQERQAMRKELASIPPPDSAEQIAEFLIEARAFQPRLA